MPGALLRFRDSTGRVVATVTADAHGEFRLQDLGPLCRNAIDGFALSWATHSTGGADQFRFTPLVTQKALFHDKSGQPVPGLAVSFQPDMLSRGVRVGEAIFDTSANQQGVAQITNAPAGAHFDMEILDRRYIVKDVKALPAARAVRYDVTVTPPALITRRLLTPDAHPRRGFSVYATQARRAGQGESPDASADTGPTRRFRFRPLRPDEYYVSAQPLWRPGDIPSARRVSVGSGQTVTVELRGPGPLSRRAPWTAPHR